MKIDGTDYRTIWLNTNDSEIVQIIDQRHLPHEFVIEDLKTVDDAVHAIKEMHVRGAPLVGATAAFGMYLAAIEARNRELDDTFLKKSGERLKNTRPTAVNLKHAVDRQLSELNGVKSSKDRVQSTRNMALQIKEEELESCKKIGNHGFDLLESLAEKKEADEPLQILTHCNAGWLACIDYGTATAPVYTAHDRGLEVHVWVDETRPRNQGARLTAWELNKHGVPHTVVVDSTGGLLMQKNKVDVVLVGTDRTTAGGDVVNKIGTYPKALAAHDNDVPFYVALPTSTLDTEIEHGADVPIEMREAREVSHVRGKNEETGQTEEVQIIPDGSPVINYAFDVTPSHLVTGLITDRGVIPADSENIHNLLSP